MTVARRPRRDATVIAGFLAGKRLLAAQSIDVHEIIICGDRVAVAGDLAGDGRGRL